MSATFDGLVTRHDHVIGVHGLGTMCGLEILSAAVAESQAPTVTGRGPRLD